MAVFVPNLKKISFLEYRLVVAGKSPTPASRTNVDTHGKASFEAFHYLSVTGRLVETPSRIS